MNVLLFSMPDVMTMFPPNAWRPPQIGIASLAANTTDHEVTCADLVVRRENVAAAVREAMERTRPRLVGLSAMSFQYDTALKVAELVRRIDPGARIVLGGYHATLLWEEIAADERASGLLDFLVRGEGETSFNALVHALAASVVGGSRRVGMPPSVVGEAGGHAGPPLHGNPGLSWKHNGTWTHNARGPLEDLERLRPPKRSARLWQGEYFLAGTQDEYTLEMLLSGRLHVPIDVVETSRGCTMACNFCSMQQMYGRSFRVYPIERVMADIADSKSFGAQWIIFADDNITLDVARLEALCDAIIRSGHNDVRYIIQASSAGIASSERLVASMARAGMRVVFLGIESASPRNLRRMKKGDILDRTRTAIRYLHKHKLLIVGGMITGLPDDTAADVEANYRFFAEQRVDFYGDQIATPYPKTPLREEYLREGLVTNPDDFRRYDGFWANVRTKHLSSDDLQFLRWKLRRRYSTFHSLPPVLRASLSVFAVLRTLFYRPLRNLLFRFRDWNRTQREIFEADMKRCAGINDFFGGRE